MHCNSQKEQDEEDACPWVVYYVAFLDSPWIPLQKEDSLAKSGFFHI